MSMTSVLASESIIIKVKRASVDEREIAIKKKVDLERRFVDARQDNNSRRVIGG